MYVGYLNIWIEYKRINKTSYNKCNIYRRSYLYYSSITIYSKICHPFEVCAAVTAQPAVDVASQKRILSFAVLT